MLDYKIIILRDLCRLSYYMYYSHSMEDRECEYIGNSLHCKKIARELQNIGDSYIKITFTMAILKAVKCYLIAFIIG